MLLDHPLPQSDPGLSAKLVSGIINRSGEVEALQTKLTETEKKLTETQNKLAISLQELKDKRKEKEAMMKQIQDLHLQISKLTKEKSDLQSELSSKDIFKFICKKQQGNTRFF